MIVLALLYKWINEWMYIVYEWMKLYDVWIYLMNETNYYAFMPTDTWYAHIV